MKTAVEWIFEELENKENGFPHLTLEQIYKQAKEMENQQQGYSEEEVIDLLKALQIGYYIHNERVDIEQWFEQFKNK